MTEELIVVDYGKGQVSLNGNKMIVQYISNGRMYIRGSFNSIEFTGDK